MSKTIEDHVIEMAKKVINQINVLISKKANQLV